jgi:hypothetical protein
MQYYRCKCGYRKCWSSGLPVRPCDVCPKCGSTLAINPDSHATPEPHQWITRYDERTGEPYEMCTKCFAKKPANLPDV